MTASCMMTSTRTYTTEQGHNTTYPHPVVAATSNEYTTTESLPQNGQQPMPLEGLIIFKWRNIRLGMHGFSRNIMCLKIMADT